MAKSSQDFLIDDLTGGLNDTDPPSALDADSCQFAENVEFFNSMLGERRKGCIASTGLPASITGSSTLDTLTWGFRHIPGNDETEAELWLLAEDLDGIDNLLVRNVLGAWAVVSPDDAIDSSGTNGHRMAAQTLHDKLFVAYKSDQDRLHVWDGSGLIRTGIDQPDPPTVVDEGAGTFAGVRYYRIRYTAQTLGDTVRRSEPSESTTFTPSGTGAGARITKPAAVGEGETHWEVEASVDDSNFYRIATVAVGTTTYDDEQDYTAGYTFIGDLSEDIGDYSFIPSGKFLTADDDRLIIAGSWEDENLASRVWWTPVGGGPGVGNDERLETDTDPFLDLDGFEGGGITGISRPVNGYIFAFKLSHIYKLVRTGTRSKAYEAFPLTKTKGALPGSLIEAHDQAGNPSLYFLDPRTGPMRIGSQGIQSCSRDIEVTWDRVNIDATIPCHGVFYPEKKQIHWWVAIDDAEYPNFKIVSHINAFRNTDEGARKGWVTVSKDSRIATAHCSVMFSANLDDLSDPRELNLVPMIGKQVWNVGATAVHDLLQICDTGNTDAHSTADDFTINFVPGNNQHYWATLKTKPFMLAGLMNQYGIMAGAILAKASTVPEDVVWVNLIRDFGSEELPKSIDLDPTATEPHVIKQLDNLGFSELYALEIELGDLDGSAVPAAYPWELNGLALKQTTGQSA